jgi:hypothetical protein
MTHCPYFGDFALVMLRRYVGDTLLRIQVPADFPGLYVADMAHNFECKYQDERGVAPLGLGYDCRTYKQVMRVELNSYVAMKEYVGGHVLPNVKATRKGEGIVIPSDYISVNPLQPLR